MVLDCVAPVASQATSQVSSSTRRDEHSLGMEVQRRQWLAERELTPPTIENDNAQATISSTHAWVVPDAVPPSKVVQGAASGTAPGFKVVNFDRPMLKPAQTEMVMPDISEVMSIAGSKDGDATEPKTVKDAHAFWGKKDREAKACAGKVKVGSIHSLSKIDAQARLQRHITSGSRIDWDEVRKLRKIIAEAE